MSAEREDPQASSLPGMKRSDGLGTSPRGHQQCPAGAASPSRGTAAPFRLSQPPQCCGESTPRALPPGLQDDSEFTAGVLPWATCPQCQPHAQVLGNSEHSDSRRKRSGSARPGLCRSSRCSPAPPSHPQPHLSVCSLCTPPSPKFLH